LEAAHAAASFRETELVGVTVEEQVEWIAERLASLPPHAPLSTAEWFAVQPSKGARAALLLAMLELARKGFLLLHQPREFAPLQVKAIREIPEYIELDLLAYAPAG